MSNKKILHTTEADYVSDLKASKPWYSKAPTSIVSLIFLGLIDTAGFVQGMLKALPDTSHDSHTTVISTYISMGVMILAFIVSFEVATIYMGYAFSLRLYHYDKFSIKRINADSQDIESSKFVSTTFLGWLSFLAFILGIIANIIFRLGLMENIEFFNNSNGRLTVDGAITLVMVILPIITSIINFVISCFTFDPILFELNYISKAIGNLKLDISNLTNKKEMIQREIDNIDYLKQSQEKIYSGKINYANSLRLPLRTRIYEEQMKGA